MKSISDLIKKVAAVLLSVALILGLVYLFIYFTDQGEAGIPLKERTVFRYEGEYVSRGSQKSITMKAHQHRIVVERSFVVDGQKQFLAAFYNGDERWYGFILVPKEDGLYMRMGKRLILVIPRKVKRGMKWQFNTGYETMKARVGPVKTFNTPMGKIKAREITYQSEKRSRIKLWVNKDKGVVALHYSYLGGGTERNEANLELVSVGTLEQVK